MEQYRNREEIELEKRIRRVQELSRIPASVLCGVMDRKDGLKSPEEYRKTIFDRLGLREI